MNTNTLPRHPRTGLRAIGYGRRGPIWPVMGGDGNGDGGTGGSGSGSGSGDGGAGGSSGDGSGGGSQGGSGGSGDAGGSSGGQGTGGTGGGPQGGSGGSSGGGSGQPSGNGDQGDGGDSGNDDLANMSPDDLAKLVRDLRKENGRDRSDGKKAAADEARKGVINEIGKALGLVQGDGNDDLANMSQADLVKLVQDERGNGTKAAETARQARVELAVYQNADGAGGDPKALLDSRSFVDAVGKLDPDGDGFAGKVEAAIKKAVTDNPKLAAGNGPAKRGGEPFTGGSGEGKGKKGGLEGAVASHYGK